MKKNVNYVIFPVKWGYFGIAGSEKGLLRTCLPAPRYKRIKSRLLKNLPLAQFNRSFLKQLQQQIVAYFGGAAEDFGPDIPADLTELTHFQAAVLTACRHIKLGQTITYAQLAESIGRPNAARAVGNALAKNPLPLVIPCHRVLAANNKLGGFSAPGGIRMKKKLVIHEKC
jgi:methylated-DNA-[protein]-cysteine S-methyltransferase